MLSFKIAKEKVEMNFGLLRVGASLSFPFLERCAAVTSHEAAGTAVPSGRRPSDPRISHFLLALSQ